MERLTGVVMEQTGNHVVLMTPQGEFKRVRITGTRPEIGAEICIPVASRHFFRMPRARWLAVAAAIILLIIASPSLLLTMVNQPPEVAAAYVWLDNPGIELTLSNQERVIEARAYNQAGTKILAGVALEGADFYSAVARVTKEAVKLGMMDNSQKNMVLASVSPLPGSKIDRASLDRTLLASVNNVLSNSRIDGAVQTIHVPSGIRENAKKKGLSPGKYAVLIEAVNAGLPVTEKDMQEKSIVAAIASAGGQPEQIIGQAQKEDRFELKEQQYLAIAGKTVPETPSATVPEGQTGSGTTGKKLIEPIRKSGGPEDRQKDSPSKPVTEPDKTGKPTQPVSDNDNSQPENPGDQETGDYMGPQDNPDQPDSNNDMYRLKPNF